MFFFQHHDSIVTAADLGLALNCQYDLSNRTILNDFDLVSNISFVICGSVT